MATRAAGPSSVAQLHENVVAAGLTLSDGDLADPTFSP